MKIQEQVKILEEAFSQYKQLKKELEWWRTYGEYVAKVHNNVDAEACGFADGDEEYLDNVETEYKGPFDKRLLQELNNIL